ncbi:MAG: hypothetical protein DWQ07_21860 [Chloroflexi bacterium]|nr:MAG: hypothetical protein DWQ07_21860 [Chloroflexota bacterium]MBL1196400.1 FtsX-like permease family protein [Chloroflexota bacterium]NOH13695.1 ABC transporter permease [Chloroflexota bacterium]
MAFYLAFKEVWRNKGRFLTFSMVIALITVLVLFIAALATGLANANKQYIDNLDADLLVYQENVDIQLTSSRIGESRLNDIRRLNGVADLGLIGFASGTIVFTDGREELDISLIGVQPGKPGEPAILAGQGLRSVRADEIVLPQEDAQRAGIKVGDQVTIKTIQGTEEEFFDLLVVGLSTPQQYFFQPGGVLPLETWDEIRPQAPGSGTDQVIGNIIAVKLEDPALLELMSSRIEQYVNDVEAADKPTAILALPGYSAQQSTLSTQQFFTFFIGVLVVGGFFQIQTLQKVGQIGMLKAIGTPNRIVASASLLQIIFVTAFGVFIGGAGTLLLALSMPAGIPIVFSGAAVIASIAALLLIGPMGGLVAIRLALRVEPLNAIGL